jgi:amidohydrolase
MTTQIMNKALEIKDYITNLRRQIHSNPELGFREYKTTELISSELKKIGVETLPLSMETGVVGIIKGTKSGTNRVTAIRADIDALPILEQTDLAYSSKNPGVMHACGHDGHTAILLGVAKVLNSMKDEFSGVVKLVFQPSEESLTGSEKMLEEKVLDNPRVDNIVTLHGWPEFKVGEVGSWNGKYMAAGDIFKVKIKGKGGHGCRPYKAINPIVASSQITLAIQNIVSSEIVTSEQAVISVCTFNAGTAFNIIPDEVIFGGTVRCLDENVRQDIRQRIERIIKGICIAFNCKYELDYKFGVPPLVNDREIVENLLKAADAALGEGHIKELSGPVMGSEDFSNYVNYIGGKGALLRLGLASEEKSELVLHNEKFDFNDRAIPIGIAVMTQYVLNTNR